MASNVPSNTPTVINKGINTMPTAISTKGIKIKLVKADATPLELVPTAISAAKPAVVTVADSTGASVGDVVEMGTVGFEELDGKMFVVSALTATEITLLGSDTTDTTGVLAASPTMKVYPQADEVILCLSGIDVAAGSVGTIDTSTFCGPETLPGAEQLGTITIDGYTNKDSAGLAELIKADADGVARIFKIELPQDQGYYVGKVALSGLSYGIPLEGALSYTLTGTQLIKMTWLNDVM